MKKIIPTKAHAVMDYGSSIILLIGPWILLFEDNAEAKYAFVFAGAFILLQSLFTNYEGGLVKVIPVKFHLFMDVVLGLALLSSPWVFGFAEQTWLWHVLMGGMSVFAGLFTSTKIPEFLSMKGM